MDSSNLGPCPVDGYARDCATCCQHPCGHMKVRSVTAEPGAVEEARAVKLLSDDTCLCRVLRDGKYLEAKSFIRTLPSCVLAVQSPVRDEYREFGGLSKQAIDARLDFAHSLGFGRKGHTAHELLAKLHTLGLTEEQVGAVRCLYDFARRNVCNHGETHRGGAIWEICDYCGARWADDEGGKPEWKEPKALVAARAAFPALFVEED